MIEIPTRPEAKGLQKMPTGIEGLDEISGGGLPRGRTTLVIGGSGCGKSVLALQTLVNGVRQHHEPGIFVAFEESVGQIMTNAAAFGWDLASLEPSQLFFLDARLSPAAVRTGYFDLTGLLSSLSAQAAAMGAKRIVFDGLDVLLTLIDDPVAEREEIYRLHAWLADSGLTGLVTAKADGADTATPTHYGFMQYMVDCLLVLEHRYVNQVSLRSIRLTKYRGSDFLANGFPMVIGPQGVEFPHAGGAERDYVVFTDRISTGIERLDNMLGGGYLRGTSILLSGAPGTAKSTLAGAFVAAACQRGERALYLSMDEAANEILRNLTSVGIDLAADVASGRLRIYSAASESKSADQHLLTLRGIIREHRPDCLVVDPLSAMIKAGGQTTAASMTQRLLRLTKRLGITVLFTSLVEGANPEAEGSLLEASSVADTWMHLSYIIQGGERNRALTIIKSRGTRHSNQVRELILTNTGVTLADVYTAGGHVLLGTARWEKEADERAKDEQLGAALDLRSHELEVARQETQGRMATLREELKRHELELAQLQKAQIERGRRRDETQNQLSDLRRGQSDAASEPTPRADTSAAQPTSPDRAARPRPSEQGPPR